MQEAAKSDCSKQWMTSLNRAGSSMRIRLTQTALLQSKIAKAY